MIAVTVDEIATVLGADLSGPGDTNAVVTALTADSRTVNAGARSLLKSAGSDSDAGQIEKAANGGGRGAVRETRRASDLEP